MKLEILKIREAKGSIINASVGVYAEMIEEAKADREIFWTLHLNSKNKIIEKEIVAIGHLSGADISPREVVRKAVLNSTSQIICVHNHPSGDPEPSLEDKAICQAICYVCRILDIKMLDFIVIAQDGYFSFADEEILDDMIVITNVWRNSFGFINK